MLHAFSNPRPPDIPIEHGNVNKNLTMVTDQACSFSLKPDKMNNNELFHFYWNGSVISLDISQLTFLFLFMKHNSEATLSVLFSFDWNSTGNNKLLLMYVQ